MVPPEEIEKAQPSTLPADFGEWDNGENPEAEPPASPKEFEGYHASNNAPKPVARPATARVAVLPVASRIPAAPPRIPAATRTRVEQVYQPPQFQSEPLEDLDDEDESKGKRKKVMFAAIGSVALLLILVPLGYFKLRPKTVVPNQTVVSQTAISNMDKPTPSTPTDTSAATTTTTATTTPAATTPDVPVRAQSEMMSHQLNAPSRIPTDLKMLAGREAPPSADFGSAGSEGLGSGNVFSGQSGPKVRVEAPKKVNISAGVAVGLLVQKTPPLYPPIAKTARVSGTVVIQATISKTGAIGNLRAVSGPSMLRQAALDAVKTWRFRPYMLDGEPVEVETTVNVNFALAQ